MDTSVSPARSTTAALASVGQRHLWLFDRLYARDGTYNIAFGIHLRGPLRTDVLIASLNAIVERHEALRTTFAAEGDDLLQIIADRLDLEVPVVDVTTEGDIVDAIKARLGEDAARPFDLGAGPLIRTTLYRLSATDAVLGVTVHHIVFDGWSLGVLLNEIGALYSAFLEGQPNPLAPLPIQFADYAEWQREQLTSAQSELGRRYWRERLTGVPTRIELPTDRPYRGGHARRGRLIGHTAPAALRAAVNDLARREHVTLFMVLMGAFASLISRYGRASDFLIGTPVAGRDREELEPLIGFVMKTVFIRADLTRDPTVRELLGQMKTLALDAQRHQDTPLEDINQIVTGQGPQSLLPFAQVMLALQNATPEPSPFAGLDVSMLWVHSGTAKYDVFLNVVDDSAGLRYELEYDTDLFDESTASRMLASYGILLEAFASHLDARVSALPILPPQDVAVIASANSTARPFPRDTSVHALFDAQVARTPDAVAVVFGDRHWTYRELDARARHIANVLRTKGVTTGTLVGLCVNRSADMVAAMLGIVRAGGAYVPIDPAYPTDRITWVLENSQAPLVVTEQPLRGLVEHVVPAVICLDQDDVVPAVTSLDAVHVGGSDLAYVLYTSGSTGRPKGVEIQHRALVNFLTSMQEVPGLSERDTLVAITTLSFDIAGLEIWLPLTRGARVVVAPREASGDPLLLRALLERSRATVLQATPSTWRLLLESGWAGDSRLKALCGGEAMPADLPALLVPRVGELWNMYGPTETTIWSTCRRITDDYIDIGHPIANTDVLIVDERGQQTPVGVPGEILIAGDGLARGYFDRPDLTAERFVAHPIDASRLAYRTGDLGRWRSDGRIDCLGRLDHQLKLRGFRVEPGEIESVLAEVEGVGACVVIAREDSPGSQHLVAYFEKTTTEPPSADTLRTRAERRLPAYMVPSAFVCLDRLPLTPNGKIDRRSLPAPLSPVATAPEEVVTPSTPTEEALCRIWQNVIGVTNVGVTDSFFELGGHSLLAIRLFGQIRDVMGIELPFGLLLQNPTVRSLAVVIDRQTATSNSAPVRSALAALRATGTRPPIFFIHTVGGEIWSFTAITKRLGDDQPVYGLQAADTPDQKITVEDMASRYLEEIRQVAPHGPYVLAGHCAGAATAYEIARQLSAAGERVGLLAVLDYTFFDTSDPHWRRRVTDFAANVPAWIADDFGQVSLATILGRVRSKLRILGGKLRARLSGSAHAETDIRDTLGMWRFPDYQVPALERYFKAFQSYVPQPYDGDLLLVRPRAIPLFRSRQAPDLGWGRVVKGRVDVRVVRGSHETMLHEPMVAEVAKVLADAIDGIGTSDATRERR